MILERERNAVVKSMTGYGRGETVWNGHAIVAEVRSVNNRYLDCTVKLPRMYAFAEDAVKSAVQASQPGKGRGLLHRRAV